MNRFQSALLLSLCVLAMSAQTKTLIIDVPEASATPATTLTRADVLADMFLWRASGLEEVTRGERVETEDARYKNAKARYEALRASPEFNRVRAEIERDPRLIVLPR